MKIASRIVLGAVLVVSGEALAASPYAANLKQSAQAQVCRASQALADAQLEQGWSWQKGEREAALNVSGLVASALARAPTSCGATTAVERYARATLARHQKGEFLYDPDVEALAAAAQVTGDARYAAAAREAFQRRYELATGEEIVERWFMNKRDARLIGFEAASAIRAALAVGEVEKAQEVALASARASRRWVEGWDPRGFLTTSRGAMLEALSLLEQRTAPLQPSSALGRFKRDLVHHLLLTQASDGSWEGRNTQSTAYAVRGLVASREEAAAGAATLGERWLRLTQLQDGSWATFNDLLPEPFVGEVVHEVTAEVLLAVSR